jgi:glutamate---cysteine ligase / carboxylate-amine ligase
MSSLTEAELRAIFDAPEPLTVGLEEEVMLVDPVSFALLPLAGELAAEGFKLELPASQLEIVTKPAHDVATAVAELEAGRHRLAELVAPRARLIGAGVHPFAAPLGELNRGGRYDAIAADHGEVARAQLVCALQVHVAVGSADATLAVHNALRGHLPELAALAANAPYYAGRDTGFASVRPLVGGLLPRQGVPPVIGSWSAFAEMLRWTGDPKSWWYEVRPHVGYGTLEVRVCDAQATVGETAALATFVHGLVRALLERYEAGEDLGAPETWRIVENRWLAARHGLDAPLADLVTGERRPARERLAALAPPTGCEALLEANGADRQREVGLDGVTGWLADRFLSPWR